MNAPVGNIDLPQRQMPTRCRSIECRDLPAVLDLLVEGFPRRSRRYWTRGLERLAQRPAVAECPQFGFLIEAEGTGIVGCLLLIVSEQQHDGRVSLRGNVSSWYVRPQFRFQAAMLVSLVFRLKKMTVLNISPAPHTIPILQAQGYRQYVAGQAVSLPAFSRRGAASRVERIHEGDARFADRIPNMELLWRHARLGCIVVVCIDGERYEPFIFARRRIVRTILPAAQLVWCRDIADFAKFSGAIGRHLLMSGIFAVSCDANGQMPGIASAYRAGTARKFYRGPDRPRLGDLADTELVIFGS